MGAEGNMEFQIVGNELRSRAILDRNTSTTRNVRIRTTDSTGTYFEKTFEILILDDNRYDFGEPFPDAGSAPQALFGTETTILDLDIESFLDPNHYEPRLFRFVVDGVEPTVPYRFELSNRTNVERGRFLTLFDQDGNVLQAIHSDPVQQDGFLSIDVSLERGKIYVLGAFFHASVTSSLHELVVRAGEQLENPELIIHPNSGNVVLDANSGENIFNSTNDVDYYPLNLRNGGSLGNVTLTPLGLDVQIFATIFRRNNSESGWRKIAEGQGDSAFVLNILPEFGYSLTDDEYLLAVSPLDFNTPSRDYRLEVSSQVLLPNRLGQTDMSIATDLSGFMPQSLGRASLTRNGTWSSNQEEVFRLRSTSRTTHIHVDSTQVVGNTPFAIGVYSELGDLITVHTRYGNASLDFDIEIPTDHFGSPKPIYLRIRGASDSVGNGNYQLTVAADYNVTPFQFGPDNNRQVDSISIQVGIQDGPKALRVSPNAPSDVLSIQVRSNNSEPTNATVILVGANRTPVVRQSLSTEPVFLAMDVHNSLGPFDVFILGGNQSSTYQVMIGRLNFPKLLATDDFQTVIAKSAQEFGAGNLSTAKQLGQSFGALQAVKHYSLLSLPASETEMDQRTTLEVQQANRKVAMAYYVEEAGKLKLQDWELPNDLGVASITTTLSGDRVYAIAALNIGLDTGGAQQVQFNLNGPNPVGLGVGMVPNTPVPVPGVESNLPPNFPYANELFIKDIALESQETEHLWKTILPYNITNPNQIVFTATPTSITGDLKLSVQVYLNRGEDDPNDESNPSHWLEIGNGPSELPLLKNRVLLDFHGEDPRGKTVYIRVAAKPGWFGDGTYTLYANVPTTNPHPYEVLQTAWILPPGNTNEPKLPLVDQEIDISPLPENVVIRDVPQNQFGDSVGSIQGTFAGNNLNEIHIYRFKSSQGPLSVRTVPVNGLINTNFRLYERKTGIPDENNLTIDYLQAMVFRYQKWDDIENSLKTERVSIPVNFDWFAADRRVIDAQFYGDLHWTTTNGDDGWVYAVVRNQEGSKGTYRFEVNAPNQSLENTIYVPPTTGGQVEVELTSLGDVEHYVRYIPVQLPDYHDGRLVVSSQLPDFLVSGTSFWTITAYDQSGSPIAGITQDITDLGGLELPKKHTVVTFDNIPSGPTTVWLRIQGRVNTEEVGYLQIRSTVAIPENFSPPALTLAPNAPISWMSTDPLAMQNGPKEQTVEFWAK